MVRAVLMNIEIFKVCITTRKFWWDKKVETRVVHISNFHREDNEAVPSFIIRAHAEAKKQINAQMNPLEDAYEKFYIELKKELAADSYDFVEALMGDEISE
jgi:hypothetical protein